MAPWLFTDAIMAGRPIRLFNQGRMRRDFTYVDDIVEAIVRLVDKPPAGSPTVCGYQTLPLRNTTFDRMNASPELIERRVVGQVEPGVPTQFCGRMSPLGSVQAPPVRVFETASRR